MTSKHLNVCYILLICAFGQISCGLFDGEDNYGVTAEITCANGRPNREKCKEFSFLFKNSDHWNDPPTAKNLTMRYSKRFDDLECEFYINHHKSSDYSYMSICYRKSGLPAHIVEGMFFDGDYRYLPYFSKEKNTQYVMRQRLGKADLDKGLDLGNDILVAPQQLAKAKERSLVWKNGLNPNYHKDPVIEVVIMADHSFMLSNGNSSDESELRIHQFFNGAQASYQTVGVTLKIVHFIQLNQSTTEKLTSFDFSKFSENLIAFSYGEIFETSDLRREKLEGEFRVRGQPDLVMTFTQQKTIGSSDDYRAIGFSYLDVLCDALSHSLIVTPLDRLKNRHLFISTYATCVAHEIGHILGLDHTEGCDDCNQYNGVCVMYPTAKSPSGRFAECQRENLMHRISRRNNTNDCLFTTNVFQNDTDVKIPQKSRVTTHISTRDKHANVTIDGLFLGRVFIRLVQSMDLIIDMTSARCRFYRSEAGFPFTVWEWCLDWFGMIHLPDARIVIQFDVPDKSFNAYFSSLTGAAISQHNFQIQKVAQNVTIAIGIGFDDSFSQLFVHDDDKILSFISRAVNTADAVYRQIGMRIRIVGMHHLSSSNSFDGYEKQIKYLNRTMYVNQTSTAFLIFTNKSLNYPNNHKPRSACRKNEIVVVNHDADGNQLGFMIAHLIGHVMGLADEDQTKCPCFTPTGTCVMGKDMMSLGSYWSLCSQTALKEYKCPDGKDWTNATNMEPVIKETTATMIGLRVAVSLFAVILCVLLIFEIANVAHPVTGLFESSVDLN